MLNKILYILFVIFLINGCHSSEGDFNKNNGIEIKEYSVVPDSGSMYGNYSVKIKTDVLPANVKNLDVFIGNNKMYQYLYENNIITGMTQGSSVSGYVDIIIIADGVKYIIKNGFKFNSNNYPEFVTMVSVGASYTHGWVNLGVKKDFQLSSPFAQLAKHLGVYFPQSFIKDNILAGIQLESYKTSCTLSSLVNPFLIKTFEALKLLDKEGKDKFFLANYRLDPDIVPYNLGIGGNTIEDTVEGAGKGKMTVLTVFENLSYNPYVKLLDALVDPPQGSPFKYAMGLKPTILFSTDLIADDILYYAPMSITPTTTNITSLKIIKEKLRKMFKQIDDNNSYAFIANLPVITVMPIFRLFKEQYLYMGYSTQEVNRWEMNVKNIAAAYSIALTEEADKYNNIFIVDFRGMINKIDSNTEFDYGSFKIGKGRVLIGDSELTMGFLGGLVSLDAIHLTKTGYALIANMFIEEINKRLGYNIEYIDMKKVLAQDPYSTSKIKEAGVNIERCTKEFFTPIDLNLLKNGSFNGIDKIDILKK